MGFVDVLDQEISALERALDAHPTYVKLKALRAARALYIEGAGATAMQSAASSQQRNESFVTARRPSLPPAGKSADAVSAVIEILRAKGHAMRTAELLPLIGERGIAFSGNAPQSILSSLLSRSPDVVSKGGYVGWALTEWNSTEGGTPWQESPSVELNPEAQGREAGPGGGT